MLNEIVANTRKLVSKNKELYPVKLLESSIYFDSGAVSLVQYLRRKDKSGIIAEFKRKSPSKGMINQYADVVNTTIGYMQAGSSALSILTEKDYFMGRSEDLTLARNANYCPILRKDFIIDEYQVIETKSIGADAILLIAACLEKDELKNLLRLSNSLGLEVLIEIHDSAELAKLPDSGFIIGINNRDLTTMEVNIETSLNMANLLSREFVWVSESGLDNVKIVKRLKEAGYEGFLMGELFMKTPDPAATLKEFVNNLTEG